MVQTVVGETTTLSVKVVVTLPKSIQEAVQIANIDVSSVRQLAGPRYEFRSADAESFVGTKRREDTGREIRLCDGLLVAKLIGRIVSGAHDFHVKPLQDAVCRQICG